MARLKILMLCGFTQSAYIFRGKMAAIRKAIEPDYELVFLDPPHLMEPPTDPESLAQYDSIASTSAKPEERPRCWFLAKGPENDLVLTGLDETFEYLRKVLETGDFDGIWGFSQGAVLTAIVTLLLEQPHLHPIFARPGENWPPKPLKVSIMTGGFFPRDKKHAALFNANTFVTPSLHIIGRGDTLVAQETSERLAARFETARLEYHDGGHYTPSKPQWRRFFKEFLEAVALDADISAVTSPSAPLPETVQATSGGKL